MAKHCSLTRAGCFLQGIAMALGRVLVYEFDPEHAWHDTRWCAGGLPFDACYFHPVSSCTLAHVVGGDPAALRDAPLFDWRVPGQTGARALRFYRNESYHGVDTYAVLPQFTELIAASPIDPAKYHYWWRAQVTRTALAFVALSEFLCVSPCCCTLPCSSLPCQSTWPSSWWRAQARR